MANTMLTAIKLLTTSIFLLLGISGISALGHANAKKIVSKPTLIIIAFIFIVLLTLSMYYLTKLFSISI